MKADADKATINTLRLRLEEGNRTRFYAWQAHLNATIAAFKGFISLETSLAPGSLSDWLIVQRFQNSENLEAWKSSEEYQQLLAEVKNYVGKNSIEQLESSVSSFGSGVMEVFVTQVDPGKKKEFRKWSAKIHEAESQFSGFKGTFLQAPSSPEGRHWITMLQFDTAAHLDCWLASNERKEILKELGKLISSIEDHRVISPYSGWFASTIQQGEAPPGWKQAMLVILVLYPIVMLEMIFLAPLSKYLDLTVHTFIGNVLSVSLVTFPLMPFAIRYLTWWLLPHKERQRQDTLKGILLMCALYLIEILIFWIIFKFR